MSGVRIVAAGTFALDDIETAAGRAVDVGGGSAPWFAAAARWFGVVALVGAVGEDYPEPLLHELRAAGIDVEGVARRPGPTFRWRVRYGAGGERETLGTNRGDAVGGVPVASHEAGPATALFLGSMDPAAQRRVLDAGAPGLVALDTMAHWVQSRRADVEALLPRVDVLLLTGAELSVLAGATGRAGAERLRALGPGWVVVKAGADGALAYGDGVVLRAGVATPARVVDPTGAGDAFAGGLVGALAAARSLSVASMGDALRAGSAAGSFAVEAFSYGALLARGGRELAARAAALPVVAT